MLLKIVSGGQTGVDRAALDVVLELGLPCGGWCPRGRRAEDGPLAPCYPLEQTPSAEYAQRTEWNVRDSDGTLVLTGGRPTGGTALTLEMAWRYQKPFRVVDLTAPPDVPGVRAWLQAHQIRVLNVAGPRASEASDWYRQAARFPRELFVRGLHLRGRRA